MNNMQILCMDAAGETGEVIFRTPCSVGSGEVAADPDECQLVGVKADGTQHVLGTVTMPAKMKAREIVQSYFGHFHEDDDYGDAAMAYQCCLDLIAFMQKPTKVTRAAIAAATEGAV